jgi:ABC-2 type transport system permease protein
MLRAIAAFEIRYLVRNPLLWAVVVINIAAFAAATSAPGFELGSEGGLLRNASYAVQRNLMMLSLMYMTLLTAFVSNAVIRDDETGYGPIIRATRITRRDYLLGRFFGAIAVIAGCVMMAALALVIGTKLPWANPAELGPNRLAPYLFGLFVVALPNLYIGGAVLFTLAALTRSMMGSYLGVIGFTSVYFFVSGALDNQAAMQMVMPLLDPFAISAVEDITRYWTTAQRNVMTPELGGLLLANRLIWLTIASALLALACSRYRFAEWGQTAADLKRQRQAAESETEEQGPSSAQPLPSPMHDAASGRRLLWLRTRFETWQIIATPAFPVLMAWGLFTTLISLTMQRDPVGRPTYPTTLSLIPELENGLAAVPILIAIYFAGELVWRERDRRVHEIIDASPMPNWAYVIPKTFAMALVLVGTALVAVLAAIVVQMALGFTEFEISKYLLWFVLPTTWDMVLLAAMAVFVQALSPHKAVGWAVVLLGMISQQVYPFLQHNLLLYGGHPSVPLSDLADAGSFWIGAWTYRLYWGAFAVLLLVASHLLWRRGGDLPLRARLRRAGQALRGQVAGVAGVALLALAATGGLAFYNTNILAGYRSKDAIVATQVEYEQLYGQYLTLPQPMVSHLELKVELYPEERRAEVRGRIRVRNTTAGAISDVHLRVLDEELRIVETTFPAAELVHDDTVHQHRIFRLAVPMAPGEEREFAFRSERWVRGYRNKAPETRLIENGSFLYESQLAPFVGTSRNGMLEDPELRLKHGLPLVEALPALGDTDALNQPSGGGWATSDITVSTSADQTPLAGGNRVSDVTENGRRTARFVYETPTRARFVVLSARYAEQKRIHNGVELAVYHHPAHSWNVERMLDAAAQSLDYYQANFGPYQFDHFRVVELPGYYGFAQAFGGTIPYSETVGFIADFSAPGTIDQVTGMTAHELAHQWWALQVAAADMEGGGLLSETLAQYSAHLVVKHTRGEDQIRRYLQFELDRYLASRQDDDPPLIRARGEQHLLYRKGAMAMYLVQQRLGEEAVNRALRSLVERFRFQGAPYASSTDLVAALRAEASTDEQQRLITDLFERVTLYDLASEAPTAVQRADGRWDVTLPVLAKKFYVDSTGNETEAELAEEIEVGLFTAEPGHDAFAASDVVLMERRLIRSGRQVLTFIVDKRPSFAGVDPYNFYIDRESGDNVRSVK